MVPPLLVLVLGASQGVDAPLRPNRQQQRQQQQQVQGLGSTLP
jgi:hypothetical protein